MRLKKLGNAAELDDILDHGDDIDHKIKKKAEKKAKKKEYYVDPDKFRSSLKEFYKSDNLTDELALYVSNIAERMGFMPNFINYSFKNEMIGDAKVKCFKALREKKFNIKKHNPFAYFSRICYNAFVNRIKIENKEHLAVRNYQEQVYDKLASDGIIIENHNEENEDHY